MRARSEITIPEFESWFLTLFGLQALNAGWPIVLSREFNLY